MSLNCPKHIFTRTVLSGVFMSLAFSALIFSGTLSEKAYAQDLREQIVEVRKRKEQLGEVPASLQVFFGDAIEAQRIADLQDLSQYVPNFSYSQAAGATDVLVMRGLGTIGGGVHVEQSVGQLYNGFFRRRSRLNRAPLFDIQQVEVLRGPQGPTIGKNSSLGVLHINPNKPSRKREFSISASHDFESSEGYESEVVISGPITRNFLGRIALNVRDQDGWVKNDLSERDIRQQKDGAGRLILNYELANAFNIEFIYDKTELNQEGKPRDIDLCSSDFRTAIAQLSPSENCRLDSINFSSISSTGTVSEAFDQKSDFYGITLSRDYDEYTFFFSHSYTEYEIFDRYDTDLIPGGGQFSSNDEGYEQSTYEIKFVSNDNRIIDYTAGMSYLDSSLRFTENTQDDPTLHALVSEESSVDSESLSLFGQIDWHINSNLDLSFGLRWTDEERTAHATVSGLDVANNSSATTTVGRIEDDVLSWNFSLEWYIGEASMLYAALGTGYKSAGFNLGAFTDRRHQVRATRGVTSSLQGAGPVTVETVVYDLQDTDTFIYDEEISLNAEIGGRHQFPGANLFFNWTFYNTNVEDLQLQSLHGVANSTDPSEAFHVSSIVNGEATAQGLEYELLWAATDDLLLGFTGAFNITEYDEFEAPCYYSFSEGAVQSAELGCNVVAEGFSANFTDPALQDLSGETTPFAPEFMMGFNLDWIFLTNAHGDLKLGLRLYYVDDYQLSVRNSEDTVQDAFSKLDANVTWTDRTGHWKVSLVGRNLTDEIIANWSDLASLNGANHDVHAANSQLFRSAFIDQTRSLTLQAKYSF